MRGGEAFCRCLLCLHMFFEYRIKDASLEKDGEGTRDEVMKECERYMICIDMTCI